MIKKNLKAISFFLLLTIGISFGSLSSKAVDTAGLLPNAVQQYFDNSGNPLTSGKVYFYEVGTSTFKDTYTSSAATTINTNPIILNAGGKASTGGIYGIGLYRQLVKDKNNNTVWDAVTSPTGSGGTTPTSVGDSNLVGTTLPWSSLVAPNQYVFAYGQEIARVTYPEFFTAITQSLNVICSSSSNILTGLADTTQINVGSPVELSLCVVPGTTVVSKTSSTVTLSNPSSVSLNAVALFFPFGNGNGTTTFNVPDLRGYAVAGRDNMGGSAAGRLTSTYFKAPGLGATGGLQTATISSSNLPITGYSSVVTDPGHGHRFDAFSSSSTSASGPYLAGDSSVFANLKSNTISSFSLSASVVSNTTGVTVATTVPSGGNAIGIVQPTITINYVVKITPDTSLSIATGVYSIGGMTGVISCGTGILCSGNIISAVASSAITSLTGDVTATGPGTVPATLATVNSNVGTFGSSSAIPVVTVNGKGLITAITTAGLPGSFSGFANPTASVCTTAVNGSATTAMRSDAAPAYNLACSPTQTGNWTFNPTSGNAITVNTATSTQAMGLNILGVGPNSGTLSSGFGYNDIQVLGNALGGTTSGNTISAQRVIMSTGGTNESGSISAFQAFLSHNVATPANVAKGDHVAINGECTSSVNDGGINTGAGAAGTCFGGSLVAQLTSGATFRFSVTALELDAIIRTGASSRLRWGLSTVSQGDVNGAVSDAAVSIGSNAGVKWINGLLITQINGQVPIATTGCILCTDVTGSPTIATGIDLSAFTISGNFLTGPSGYSVTGAGLTTTPSLKISGIASGTQCLQASATGVVSGTGSGCSGTTSLTNTHIFVGNVSNVATDVAMSGDATMANTGAVTLASTISAGGPTGSATVSPIITYDAKGRLTTVSSATITPAVGSITGLGTGVATALGVNIGSAGAFVTFNGALGTPSSATLTNATGLPTTGLTGTLQAAQEPAHTGDVTNSAGSLVLTLATVNSNVGSFGSATQSPTYTVNGKGLITAATNVTITPAVGSITGLGTGIATALAVNVGTAGSPVINGGALGSPSSAGTLPAHTLGGTIAGGGNQINNVIIGTTTPLAGFFTTVSGTTSGAFGASAYTVAATVLSSVGSGTSGLRVNNTAAAGTSGGAGIIAQASATPTALGHRLGFYNYGVSDLSTTDANAVSMAGFAAEAWTIGSAQGAYWDVQTTPVTTTARVTAMRVQASGGVYIGAIASVADPLIGGLALNGQAFIPNMASDTATADSTVCTATTGGKLLKGTGTLGICLGTSSERFKNNIIPMRGGLSDLVSLQPKNFFYKKNYGDDGKREQYGFTAEDFVKVFPKLTHLDKEGKPLSIDLVGLIPVMVQSIKELKVANDNFEIRLKKLEAK